MYGSHRQSFESGKIYGRRQTFWDVVMRLFSSRDRNFLSLLLELIFTVAINFTAGMFCSRFIFVFRLPWLVASYQPSLVSGSFIRKCSSAGSIPPSSRLGS